MKNDLTRSSLILLLISMVFVGTVFAASMDKNIMTMDKNIQIIETDGKDSKTECQSLTSLGEAKDPSAIGSLTQSINDTDINIRLCSIGVLKEIRDQKAEVSLIHALHDNTSIVRRKAAEALGELGDKRAIDPLIHSLKDDDSGVRREAALALERINASIAIEPLKQNLADNDPGAEKEVRFALKRLENPESIKPLPPAIPVSNISHLMPPLKIQSCSEELHICALPQISSNLMKANSALAGSSVSGQNKNAKNATLLPNKAQVGLSVINISLFPPNGDGNSGGDNIPGQNLENPPTCDKKNIPSCGPGMKPICNLMTAKWICAKESGPLPPISYVTVEPSETTAIIGFLPSGSNSGDQITVHGGLYGSNAELFAITKVVDQQHSSMDYLIENLNPYTRYWFKISREQKDCHSGDFSTLCHKGSECGGPYTICTEKNECAYCGGLGQDICSNQNKPCDNPYGIQGIKCQECTDQEIPADSYCKALPTSIVYMGRVLDGSDLGSIDAEEMQGLAQSVTHWYWMTKLGLYRVVIGGANIYSPVDASVGFPAVFWAMGYNHFGDGDFYNGKLYVPITGDGVPPAVLVYDEGLNLLSWGTFSHGGGAWIAINPQDGLLYTGGGGSPYGALQVYEMNSLKIYDGNPSSQISSAALGYIGKIQLEFIHTPPKSDSGWWNKVYGDQGGAFSPNGVFYYVLDHGTDEDSSWTGIHTFRILPFSRNVKPSNNGIVGPTAKEITLMGDENVGFMHVSYDPCWSGLYSGGECMISRGDELEGATAYRDIHGTVSVLLARLGNSIGEDDVVVYYWTVNEP